MSISFFPIFENMLNTFFFGYLALKWRRLIRSISIFIWLILTNFVDGSLLVGLYRSIIDLEFEDSLGIFFMLLFSILLIGIISWIIKPFVVKED